jgi:uncharacterized protein (TIGR02284 family)
MINDYEATQPITTDTHTNSAVIDNDSVISTLNGLIETCKDGQEGFKEASGGVENSQLKTYFNERALERSKYAGDLQSLVQTLGGDPEKSGSIAGAIHRGWMNIKTAVVGKDEASILNECERGEDSAKASYQKALDETLPDYVRETVQNQFQGVVASHDQVKVMRDAANAKATSATSNR